VNLPLNKSNHHTLFHFIHLILTQHEKTIGDQEFEIVKLIIEAKANVNYINNGLNVLTMIYIFRRNINETENIIKLLLDNKTDNYNPLLNHSALDYAVKSDCWRSVKLLLKNGVIPDETIFSKYNDHFLYHKGPITKLLIECMPSEILFNNIFIDKIKDGSLLCIACNIGCANASRRLLESDTYYGCGIYNRLSTFVTHNIVDQQTLLKIVMLNIKDIETSTDQSRKNILGDGKDLSNYIEIAKLLIDYGACIEESELNEIVHSHAIKRKNIINEYLSLHFPKVLVDVIIEYYFRNK
jgi:ankyrin repeat protein